MLKIIFHHNYHQFVHLQLEGNISQIVTLVANSSITFIATATIASNQVGTINNKLKTKQSNINSNVENNSAQDSDEITISADIQVTKSNGVTQVIPEKNKNYTVYVVNLGLSNISSNILTITDIFDSSIIEGISSWQCVATGSATCGSGSSGSVKILNILMLKSRKDKH
eukprot:TRINITY_DN2517_c0_g3_i2.p1 TRINITY_DN2517_c0_g3~~TRINITY_DN2517_c0_g3_i2.p1  ORF type:complete len:169 (-),score=49.07 TRINITY_DN2517_c0_g3_i2:1054-1560(-)